MKPEEIENIIKWIDTLEDPDEKNGAMDAIGAIIKARQGGPSMPPPGKVESEIDPKLKFPEFESDEDDVDDTEIDDPDDVLKDMKDDTEKGSDDKGASDDEEDGDGDGSDGDSESTDSEKDSDSTDGDSTDEDSEGADADADKADGDSESADGDSDSDSSSTANGNTDSKEDEDTEDDEKAKPSKADQKKKSSEDKANTGSTEWKDDESGSGDGEENPEDEESEGEGSGSGDDDTTDSDEDEDKEGKGGSGKSSDEDEEADADDTDKGEGSSDSDDTTDDEDGESSSAGSDSEDDDLIDDTESDDIDDSLAKDAEEERKKEDESFRRKVEAAETHKLIQKALKKDEAGESDNPLTEAEKTELQNLDKQLKDIYDELDNDKDSVKKMSAKDFDDLIQKALDLLDKAGIKHVDVTDVKDRIEKIKLDNEDEMLKNEMDSEDQENRIADPEFQKKKAREREKERLEKEIEASRAAAFRGNLDTFKADLKRAIKDQVSKMMEKAEETWAKVNRHHEDDDLMVPGFRIDEVPEDLKPTVDIYFDQSGSWGYTEVNRGLAAIKDILQFEKEGLIDINIFYFSCILSTDQASARALGSRECWDYVIQNIDAPPKTKNVIIMTDTDIRYNYGIDGCHGCVAGPGTTVDGIVWYLWKNGDRVPEARTKLKGKMGTYEYSV